MWFEKLPFFYKMMASQSVFSMGGMQEKIEDLKQDFSEDNMFQKENKPCMCILFFKEY